MKKHVMIVEKCCMTLMTYEREKKRLERNLMNSLELKAEPYLIDPSSVICESTSIIISFNYQQFPSFCKLFVIYSTIHHTKESFISKTKAPVLDCSTFPGFSLHNTQKRVIIKHHCEVLLSSRRLLLVPWHFWLGDFPQQLSQQFSISVCISLLRSLSDKIN